MIDTAKFRDIYISEAEDNLQKLESDLLAYERDPTQKKLLDDLMRYAHTIKGSSAAMEYKTTAFLTHIMEDVFDAARHDLLAITPAIISELFTALDALKDSLIVVKDKGQELDLTTASARLKKVTGVATEGTGKSLRTADGKPLAKVTTNSIEAANQPPVDETAKSAPVQEEKISFVKVPVERLDKLMSVAGEIMADKMRLEQMPDKSPDLKVLTEHLGRLVSDLQYQVMEVRLIPLEQIFARFPRMIRDLSQSLNKKIDLVIEGGDIELDRTVVDKLAEPLVHLLRNAADHGIEKSGTITLRAVRGKDNAQIIVEDDGRGIDFAKVKEVAVRKNIVSSTEISKYDQAKLTELLYHSNLSTKDAVTETSGRGVGLSVVKNFVDSLGGKVTAQNLEKGTRFTLQLPPTLAIVEALLVEVGDTWYAIPFTEVEHSISIPSDKVGTMLDSKVVAIENRDIPLVFLREFFNLGQQLQASKNCTVVLVKKDEMETVGLVVDTLIARQEITVKPLPAVLKGTKGFSGATILGDGRTILIIDSGSLLDQRLK